MEFNENIVLGGSRKEYCEYGPATAILSWVYDVLGELYLTYLKSKGTDTEGAILFFGWLGVFYPLAGGCQWHGAKFCMAS